MKYSSVKRALDVLAALFLILMLGPLFIILVPLIAILQGRPVFFVQMRPGLNECPFPAVKIRTIEGGEMVQAEGSQEPAFTRCGRFLRKTSIDELPQLINIIRGEMSFVGPRPLLMDYLKLYSDTQRDRHKVRPGLTGLAQVAGRNNVDWDRRFELDQRYVREMSFFLDLKIVLRSVRLVLSAKGNEPGGQSLSNRFKGSR